MVLDGVEEHMIDGSRLLCSGVIADADDSRRSKAFIGVCVCASVYLCVCPQHNSKTKESSNLIQGMTLGYPRSIMVLGQKVKGQCHRVTKCKTYSRRSSGRCEFAFYRVLTI